jgi:hypothetical protein
MQKLLLAIENAWIAGIIFFPLYLQQKRKLINLIGYVFLLGGVYSVTINILPIPSNLITFLIDSISEIISMTILFMYKRSPLMKAIIVSVLFVVSHIIKFLIA